MAIIVGAFGGGSIKGKLSGNVYQGSRGGQLIRNWVKPVDPASTGQVSVRIAMQQASQVWADDLTDAQRTGWQEYAAGTPLPNRFGTTSITDGRQMFIRTFVARFVAGLNVVSDAPPTPGVATGPINGYTLDASDGIELASTSFAIPADGMLLLSLSIPVTPARSFYKSPFTTGVGIISTDTLPVIIKPSGPQLVVGQRYFIRERYYAPDGKVSNFTIRNLGLVTA